jgi:outer membrane lipoprotein-sorting protein
MWTPRVLVKLAAAVTIAAGVIVLLSWPTVSPVRASAVFADVLEQIRAVRTVSYTSTLTLGKDAPRTSRVVFIAPGRHRKTTPEGDTEIADYQRGKILYLEQTEKRATLIEYEPEREEFPPIGSFERLKALRDDSGKFTGTEALDHRWVNVFEVDDKVQTMTIWADPKTDLLIRVEIATKPPRDTASTGVKMTVVLTDFAWNEDLDESLFDLTVPEGYKLHSIRLMDRSRPVGEGDLVEAFRILTDLSDGAFPRSLYARDLKGILTKLRDPRVGRVDTGTGLLLLGGRKTGRDEPDPLKFLRDQQKLIQVSRGIEFVNQLTARKCEWAYTGKGVQRADKDTPVFRYRPPGAHNHRVIYADLTVRDVPAGEAPSIPQSRDPAGSDLRDEETNQ